MNRFHRPRKAEPRVATAQANNDRRAKRSKTVYSANRQPTSDNDEGRHDNRLPLAMSRAGTTLTRNTRDPRRSRLTPDSAITNAYHSETRETPRN